MKENSSCAVIQMGHWPRGQSGKLLNPSTSHSLTVSKHCWWFSFLATRFGARLLFHWYTNIEIASSGWVLVFQLFIDLSVLYSQFPYSRYKYRQGIRSYKWKYSWHWADGCRAVAAEFWMSYRNKLPVISWYWYWNNHCICTVLLMLS
jgi:hypothetical protein